MHLDLILYVQLRVEVHRDVFSNREYGVYLGNGWSDLAEILTVRSFLNYTTTLRVRPKL